MQITAVKDITHTHFVHVVVFLGGDIGLNLDSGAVRSCKLLAVFIMNTSY